MSVFGKKVDETNTFAAGIREDESGHSVDICFTFKHKSNIGFGFGLAWENCLDSGQKVNRLFYHPAVRQPHPGK